MGCDEGLILFFALLSYLRILIYREFYFELKSATAATYAQKSDSIWKIQFNFTFSDKYYHF